MVGAIDNHLGRTKVAAQLDFLQTNWRQAVYRWVVFGAINIKHRELECCKRERSLHGLPIVSRTHADANEGIDVPSGGCFEPGHGHVGPTTVRK